MFVNIKEGDCLDLMEEIEDQSIDMVLTDPPYGTTACKWDSVIPFEPMWDNLKRIIKPNGAIVLFSSQPFTSALVMSNPKMFKYEWIWNKRKGGNPLLSKIQPIKITENIVIFCSGKVSYFPQMVPRDKPKRRGKNRGVASLTTNNSFTEDKEYTSFYPKNIIDISNASQTNRLHPTQKPVALCEYLIKTYTNEGETVLDFTMGSGTTGVACVNLNRSFVGFEQDPEYFKIAQNRILYGE